MNALINDEQNRNHTELGPIRILLTALHNFNIYKFKGSYLALKKLE